MLHRFLAAAIGLGLCWSVAAFGQSDEKNATAADEDAIFLVANPRFRDIEYRNTVLIAAPMPNGGHVGVILNRPTNRSLISLFPEHEPSKRVTETVRYGGPFSSSALVAIIKAENNPGLGAMQLMTNLYIAFRSTTIDKVIESTPNEARYFVGFVGWKPGELNAEVDRGLWAVVRADRATVFQKDTSRLWEELIERSRLLTAKLDTAEGSRHPLPSPLAALGD